MTREQLLEEKKKIDAEYRADIAAITQLLKKYPGTTEKTPAFPVSGMSDDKPVFKLVEDAVQVQSGSFSLADIVSYVATEIGSEPQKQTVSTALFRLKEDNKIKIVQKGQGRRPAIYAKA